MTSVVNRNNLLCVINGNSVHIFDVSSENVSESRQVICEPPAIVGHQPNSKSEDGSDRILACGVSRDGKHVVACDDRKRLWVWNRTEGGDWTLTYTREVARRATSVAVSADAVLVADKSGDVHAYSLLRDEPGTLLLGHVSMLLDVVLVGEADEYLVTCDRDEKIRVSRYPNAYNIEAYCLGHTDFVSRLGTLHGEDVLFSGSGDGSIRIWDYTKGNLLFTLDLTKEFTEENDGQQENISQSECEKVGQEGVAPEVTEEGDEVMSRSRGLADVRCLACCHRNKFLAVACDKRNKVLLLKYARTDTGVPSVLVHQTIPLLSARIAALLYDDAGALWVVEHHGEQSVRVFQYDTAADQYMLSKAETGGKAELVKHLNSNHHTYFNGEDGGAASVEFETLHKVRIDNMAAYQERKQARIASSKRARAPANQPTTITEPLSKQPKTSP